MRSLAAKYSWRLGVLLLIIGLYLLSELRLDFAGIFLFSGGFLILLTLGLNLYKAIKTQKIETLLGTFERSSTPSRYWLYLFLSGLLFIFIAVQGNNISGLLFGNKIDNKIEMSMNFKVTTSLPYKDNSNYLTIRYQNASTGGKSDFINSLNSRGTTDKFSFPKSGVIKASACLYPNLIGNTDIEKSEAPRVEKTINLIEAKNGELVFRGDLANLVYNLRDEAPYNSIEIGVEIDGIEKEVATICMLEIVLGHKEDYFAYFDIIDGTLVSKEESNWFFNDIIERSGKQQIEISLMGYTTEDTRHTGFTATGVLNVVNAQQ